MTDGGGSTFAQDAPGLFDNLETTAKSLNDAEYVAAVIDKGIAEAKALLRADKPAEAERKYNETKILLERAQASIQAEPLAWRLLWIELGYLMLLLLLGYLTHKNPTYWLWNGFVTWQSGAAWFGALGGVTVGLFGLYSHIQTRDFDAKFQLWYVCKPIIGAIFGWFVVVIFVVGLVTVQGGATISNRLLLYVLAFLAGFSERFTIKIVDRLMQVLTTWGEQPGATPSTSAKAK